jgi:hypothetical protein
MKITLLVFTFLFSICNNAYSQNYMYVGSKRYSSTNTWSFGGIELSFGKQSPSSGILLITRDEDQFQTQYFGSLLFIYLKDGRQVQFNKIASDRVNGTISAAFLVSSASLSYLKKSDIDRLRYSIKNDYGKSENYLIENDIVTFETIEMPMPEAENMTDFERFKLDIRSKKIGSFDPLTFYYRLVQAKRSKGSYSTAIEINDLY